MKKWFLGGFLILSGICFYKYENSGTAVTVFAFFCILTAAALQDMDKMQISDGCCAAVFVPAFAAMLTMPEITITSRLLGTVCVSVPMLILAVVRPRAFGGGDIKLMAASGFFLGWRTTVISAVLAIIFGGMYGGYLLWVKKAEKTSRFAFGPFLCVGMMIGILYGERMIHLLM